MVPTPSRGLAVLKSLVYQYFKDHPARLLMLSAHVSHGGLGATYIWLKKTPLMHETSIGLFNLDVLINHYVMISNQGLYLY